MKLPWQKSTSESDKSGSNLSETNQAGAADKPLPKGYTPPKGRPTPTRREQEIQRGVIRDPNAMSTAQASQVRKELKKSMSKEEWREYKKKEREANRERNRQHQERMASGDERYLLARDRGVERRQVRDFVDSKRFLNNYFMPFALVMLIGIFVSGTVPGAADWLTSVMMIAILIFLIEGFIIGRRANASVRKKFPETSETGFSLGFYAYTRATQPRRWRTPRPQVELGAQV